MHRSLYLTAALSIVACGATPPHAPPSSAGATAESSAPSAPSVEAPQKPMTSPAEPPHPSTPTEPRAPAESTPALASATPSTAPVPVRAFSELPKGTTVLHVGDSMADALGRDLKVELEALGVKNPLSAKEATYIPQWASKFDTMGFRAQLKLHNPDLVIITLGGNELAMPNPSERAEPVRELVKAVGDRPCLWLAAPLWPKAPNTGLFEVIKANVAPCIFVDTNAMLKLEVLSSDGVHPTLAERKRWAQFMVRWLGYNRDPKGDKPWSFLSPQLPPPMAH